MELAATRSQRSSEVKLLLSAKKSALILSVTLTALATSVLIGWAFNIPFLKSVLPGLATMKPNTAISFLFTGLGLWRLQNATTTRQKRFAQVCSIIIVLIGLLTLGEYVFGWTLGIDQFLFIDTAVPTTETLRMSEAIAIGLTLLGCSLFLLISNRHHRIVQILALLVLGIGLLAFAGYLFNVIVLYKVFLFHSFALHTALAFCAAALAILLTSAHEGFIAEISHQHLGGVMARRLLPIVVFIPLVLGWLRLQGQYLGYYDTEFGLALFAIGSVIILTIVVWWTARSLNWIDAQNQLANVQLAQYGKRMEILHHIDRGIIASRAMPELAQSTFKELRILIPCERISLKMIDDTHQELVTYAAAADHDLIKVNRIAFQPHMLEGFDEQNTRLIADLRLEKEHVPLANEYLEQGFLTLFQVLLVQDNSPQGIITLSSTIPNFFTAEHREIAKEVADQLAIAINQLRLSEALQRAHDQLEQRVIERTAQLNATKEQVETILNNTQDAILLTNVDLGIQQANPAFEKLFAQKFDKHNPVSLLDVVHADDVLQITRSVKTALAGHNINTFEVRARRNDGSFFDAELSIGHVEGDGLVSNIHDITARKIYDRQLRYHAAIQNSVADAVIVTDLEFRIQSWNKAAERIYGWRAGEVIGKPVRDVLQTGYTTQQTTDEVKRVFIERGHWSGEVSQLRQDGTRIHILTSSVLFKDEKGLPIGVLAVNHDITERKQAEETLQTALEHEKELGDMKTRFISVASHEFRTPLTAILMTSESVKSYRHKMSDEEIDHKLDKIHQQVMHMTAILEDVLQSARMQDDYIDFQPAPDNLETVCSEIVEEFAQRQENEGRIQYFSHTTDPIISFDSRLMRQIMINLVSNALKYSPAEKPIEVKLVQETEAFRLQVRDQGIGIPQKDLKHIFEPFHRATNVGKISGTGLGMSITKKAVELHGGTISVSSEAGQGTTFTVIIPIKVA